MTSSNGNIFRVTGPLYGEFTRHRWIPRTKASDGELWCFLWSAPEKSLSKQSWGWWFETPSRSLLRHCNQIVACLPQSVSINKAIRHSFLMVYHGKLYRYLPWNAFEWYAYRITTTLRRGQWVNSCFVLYMIDVVNEGVTYLVISICCQMITATAYDTTALPWPCS